MERLEDDRQSQTLWLDSDLSVLIAKTSKRYLGLNRLGVFTIRELLNFYPRRYNDFSQTTKIANMVLGKEATILGTIKDIKLKRTRTKYVIIEASVADESGILVVTWFNQPWLKNSLHAGSRIILKGVAEHNYGFYRMVAPLFTVLEDGDEALTIMPVYSANSDISQGWVLRLVSDALSKIPAVLDPLPVSLRLTHNLMSRHTALASIHHPINNEELLSARHRLAFEEVFFLQIHMLQKRALAAAHNLALPHLTNGKNVADLRRSLPFDLSKDQQRSLSEIFADMASDSQMNRLLLGDVGSGKTIVAAFALAAATDSKTQAAMMAPTEVLAEQYAQKIGPLFDDLGISWAHLSASTKPGVRAAMLEDLRSGQISVLFGTHALLENDVQFARLSLVVIDEQHRFGVEQRQKLLSKGRAVDYLSMTATPIPRSYALTLYGDMDTSYIRTKPHSDTKVATKIIDGGSVRFAYEAIAKAIARNEQAYIICPLISAPTKDASKVDAALEDVRRSKDEFNTSETQEDIELITEFSEESDVDNIKAAEQELRFLSDKVFPAHKLALLTSKLSSEEKRRVMAEFRAGNIDILVSTTVVEVGVDVPNATTMIIQNADRFGLSQIHQLRGRVGRGTKDGAVYLVSATKNEQTLKRLKALEKSNDGFKLAEYDLALRREGDILGSKQHGMPRLRLVNVIRDAELIFEARAAAETMIKADPMLNDKQNAALGREVVALYGQATAASDQADAAIHDQATAAMRKQSRS